MEDIIALGLLYKYIVTGEKEIKGDVISSYIAAVSKALMELGSTYDINRDKSRFSSSYELSIDEKRECYSFGLVDYGMFPEIYYINKELMMASLDDGALSVLDIKADDLPVEKKIVGEREYMTLSVQDDCVNRVINKIALLNLEQEKTIKRETICSSMDQDEEIELEKLLVANIILVEDGIEKREKRIVFPIHSFPNYIGHGESLLFVDFFSDEVMAQYWNNKKSHDFIDIMVEDFEPLDKDMQERCATIGKIEEYANRLNATGTKKELKP